MVLRLQERARYFVVCALFDMLGLQLKKILSLDDTKVGAGR